jgi:hypothetical protein
MMALVAALTRHDTRGKVQRLLDTTLGNKSDDFFNTLLAYTFQASSTVSPRKMRPSLSFLPVMQRSSACGLQHWGSGWVSTEGFYCEEHFSTRDIPVVTIGFSFHSPSIASRRFVAD